MLFFSCPTVARNTVSEVIFKGLVVKCDDVIGVQNISRNMIVVKFNLTSIFNDIVRKYKDRQCMMNYTDHFKVVNLSSTVTCIVVRNATFEIEEGAIHSILSRYGKIDYSKEQFF